MKSLVLAAMVTLTATPTLAQGVAAVAMTAPMATAGEAAGPPDLVTIPTGTGVWLSLVRELSSKHLRVGDTFPMQVSRDVYVHHVLVIPRGTEATGKIGYRTGQGMFGKSAKIEFDIVDIQVGRKPLQVAGHYRVAGNGNSGAAVAVFAFTYAVGGMFVTGHSAKAPAGSEWRATTAAPLQVAFDDLDTLPYSPVQVDGWAHLAALRRASVPSVAAGERQLPVNSAYAPPPTEMFIRTQPAQP